VTRVDLYRQDPVRFDPRLVQAARSVAGSAGEPLVSGPLHDSAALAQAGVPTVMLFVPSVGGISHARGEDTREADLVTGVTSLYELVSAMSRQNDEGGAAISARPRPPRLAS
jgi:beta-ureidopropionase / N-carbamoyl-L-amino-acid hydrolase